jgi:hypothetical protein
LELAAVPRWAVADPATMLHLTFDRASRNLVRNVLVLDPGQEDGLADPDWTELLRELGDFSRVTTEPVVSITSS